MKLAYLAAPYSDKNQDIVENRIDIFCNIDSMLMQHGIMTVSPLLKHLVLQHSSLPSDWAYWGDYSKTLLARCDMLIVLKMPGWLESTGVRAEIEFAAINDIKIEYLDPLKIHLWLVDKGLRDE
jgi:hypothetical protein